MKALAKKVKGRMPLGAYGAGNKGLTLVEVICAVAIFAVIAATIGGVLVFSAKSYHRGSTESEVQQEAQFAANRISGIIQNATEVEYDSSKLTMKQGNLVHEVLLVDTDLKYKEIEKDDSGAVVSEGSLQTLAGNIKEFSADVSEFDKARTVILDMTVAKNDKEYPVRYTMNARNEEITVSTSALPPTASIHVDDNNLILVPGESYTVGVSVRGTDRPFEASGSAGISVSKTASSFTVTVDNDNRNSNAMVTLSVKDEAGTELCSKMVNVDIRSVSSVRLQKSQDTANKEYTFYADVDCLNPDKIVGGSNESNYKNPFMVEWTGKLFVCSSTPGNFDTEIGSFTILDEDDGTGKNKLFCSSSDVEKYICIDDSYPGYASREEEKSLKRPYLKIKLTEDFDSNTKLVVRATAKHPMGHNKASSPYGDASCFDEKEITVARLRATKILMIPGQTYTLNGVRVANPECSVFIGDTEVANPADAGVIPVFEADNKLKITLTEKAKGDSSGIITLKVHSQGSTATQLPVDIYVRRVNPVNNQSGIRKGTLKLDYQLMTGEGKSVNGEWGTGAEYQFKTRINGTNLYFNNTGGFINVETEEQYKQYNPFAVQFSWVLLEEKTENGIKVKKPIEGTAGSALVTEYKFGAKDISVGVEPESTTGSQQNEYFAINSFALNRESPAVNIITRKAFASNWELEVTARALHPNADGTKGRNKYNYIYTEAPDKFIEGSYTLKRKTMVVVADPTQGASMVSTKKENNTDHTYELCIPVQIGAGIGSLNGRVIGSSLKSGNTKLLADLTEMPASSSGGTAYIFLAIDRDERGGGKYKEIEDGKEVERQCVEGELRLVLEEVGASAPNAVISQTDITIYLRRVEEVKIADVTEPEGGTADLQINFLDKIKRGRDFAFYDQENGMTNDKGDREQAAVREAAQKFGFSDGMRHWVYRAQEITETDDGAVKYGNWTPYIKTKDNDANNKRLMESETNALKADKRYKLEMSLFVFDEGSKTFYWPHDESILKEGTFKGWNKGGSGWDQKTPGFDSKTLKSSYGTIYNIGQACMVFKESNGTPSKSIGSLENPKVMKPGDTYQVALDGYGIYFPHDKQFCQVLVQKRSGAGWTKPANPGNDGWNIGGSKDTFQLNEIPESANGLYRFCYDMVNSDLNHWNGNPLQPDYTRTNSETFPLYGSKGTAGYIYIRVDGTAGDTGETGSSDASYDYISMGNPDNSAVLFELSGGVTSGCGTDWEKYFKQQTDVDPNNTNNIIPVRWDRKGDNAFVGYRNPYALKWELSHDGGKTWIPLDPQNEAFKKDAFVKEYIDALKIASPSDKDVENLNTEGTLKLGLKKKLPKGTQIKLVSAHSAGINRGGREYYRAGTSEVVHDIYTVSGGSDDVVVADGFQRADDWNFASNDKNANAGDKSSIPAIRTSYFFDIVYNSTQRTFFRYKEHGTEWNASNMQYHMMDSTGERDAFFSGNLGSRLFLPDKAYDLEIVNVVYSENANGGHKYIYWPQDPSLLEAGKGWKEEGFSLWDGTWGYGGGGNGPAYRDAYESIKNTPQMSYNYLIPRSEVFFERVERESNEWTIYETIPERTQTIGSQANPFAIKNVMPDAWDWNNGGRHFVFRLAPTSFNIEKTQNHFTAQIDRLENGTWVPMETLSNNNPLSRDKYNWTMQVSVPVFDIYQVGKQVSDTYRIRSIVTNMEWTKISGRLLDSSDSRYTRYVKDVVNVYDGENGVVYLKLN